jgi:periplasmic divalent cation tolerance protein
LLGVENACGVAGMKTTRNDVMVWVTAPSRAIARRLARAVLQSRQAACANLLGPIESHYWWQERLERSNEVLILFKTTRACLSALEQIILAQHPYDTPEILQTPVGSGNERYLQWLKASTRMPEP